MIRQRDTADVKHAILTKRFASVVIILKGALVAEVVLGLNIFIPASLRNGRVLSALQAFQPPVRKLGGFGCVRVSIRTKAMPPVASALAPVGILAPQSVDPQ